MQAASTFEEANCLAHLQQRPVSQVCVSLRVMASIELNCIACSTKGLPGTQGASMIGRSAAVCSACAPSVIPAAEQPVHCMFSHRWQAHKGCPCSQKHQDTRPLPGCTRN